MATYSQLLVGTGGGVINRKQQSERTKDATVVIGIGGTGSSAVKKLKREVYKRLKPDDENSPIPTYKDIKFLIIDSDTTQFQSTSDIMDVDTRTEVFDISNNAIEATFASKDILNNRLELSWLDHVNISIKDAGNGAGGIRQVGRFLLFDRSSELKAKITETVQGAIRGVNGELTIHIFSGLSGGTGSGCFLDTCYIVRQVLKELGKENARVCGYFFLPDVNLSVPAISSDPLISSYVRVNGYVALQELDYLMDMENNGDEFNQNYGHFSIRTKKAPVDLCYLISTTNTEGTLLTNGYDYAMNVATDFVISFLSKVTLPQGVTAGAEDGGITLKGHIANLEAAKAGIKKTHGSSIDYNIIGASNAEMPLSQISTYLGSKLFEKFSSMYSQTPTEKDLIEFVSRSQLTYENIMGQLIRGIQWNITFPKYDAKMIQMGNAPAVERADLWHSNTKGALETSYKALSEDLSTYEVPKNSTSLIGRTFRNLHDLYAIVVDKGPFYAMRMLGGKDNKNLLHFIDGFIIKNQNMLDSEIRQDQLRLDDVDNAWERLRSANALNRNNRLDEYLGKLNNHYVHLGRIDQYRTMGDLLKLYRKQVIDLNNNFFNILTSVLDTLQNTFRENSSILTEGVVQDNTYTWNILSVPDVKSSLDAEVEKMDVAQELHAFVDKMFEEYAGWLNQDPNNITRIVSDFVVKEFETVTSKTITDYLRIKFDATNPITLTEKIREEIIQNVLAQRSEPLFWKNSMFNMGAVAMNCTLSVPFDSKEIVDAADAFTVGNGKFTVRKTGLSDRLFMMRFYSGMPLYAYQGLQELERAYEADRSIGRHLYEAGSLDWNAFLPSPIPASFKVVGHDMSRIEKKNQKLIDEFQEAVTKGIIYEDNGNWFIKADDIPSGSIRISLKGADQNSTQTVLKDNYLRSPILYKRVERELEKALDADSRYAENSIKDKYFNALFTGTILMQPTKVVYKYEEFGMEDNIDLQNNSMTYAKCAVYQAFLTYKDLDKKMSDKINKETANKMDNMDETIYAQAVKIKERHSADFLQLAMESIDKDAHRDEIHEFYKDFMKTLQTHLIMYKM